jgi:hypothetical protein
MDNQEHIISEFRDYARHMVEEHTIAIRQKYSDTSVNREERLKVFNRHLDSLKNALKNKISDIIRIGKAEQDNSGATQTRLLSVYDNCINDFFKKEF